MLRAACSTRPRLASNYQCEPLIYRARCVGSKFTVSFHVLAVRRSLTVINLCRSHESIHFVRCSSFGPRHFVSNVKLSLICLLATFIRDIVSMNGARSVHDYTNCRRVEVQSTWKSHTIFLCSKTVHLRDNRITNDIHVYILFKQHSATSLLFLFFLLQKKQTNFHTWMIFPTITATTDCTEVWANFMRYACGGGDGGDGGVSSSKFMRRNKTLYFKRRWIFCSLSSILCVSAVFVFLLYMEAHCEGEYTSSHIRLIYGWPSFEWWWRSWPVCGNQQLWMKIGRQPWSVFRIHAAGKLPCSVRCRVIYCVNR